MNAHHDPTTGRQRPRPAEPRPPRARLNRVRLLYTALAIQLAIWITIVLTVRSVKPAFTQAHPGFPADLIAGGAIWLVQFAAAVLVFHNRTRSRPAR